MAGGSGQRMGGEIPKQFMLLHGHSLLQHTVQSFISAYADIELIIVLPPSHLDKGTSIITHMGLNNTVHLAEGGHTRFHSVKNGLAFVSQPSIVFVHDAVRCLVTKHLIQHCFLQAIEKGSAIPAVAATDSIRIEIDNGHRPIDRNAVKIIQTPQTFQSEILLNAFQQDYEPSFTDEATVAEAAGYPVFLIEGEYNNLKITRPVDMLIAEKLLEDTTA